MRERSGKPANTSPFAVVWTGLCGLLVLVLLGGCSTSPPAGITAVTSFDVNRYAGKWYEIARLDHSFERGLTDINASYRLQPDGSLRVLNRGYDPAEGEWEQAEGRARFTGDSRTGSLEVSFFGPFYGGYHVAALDKTNYRWALVMGPSRDYFWILARDKQLSPALRDQLITRARQLGIRTERLIWVSQTREDS